MNEQLRLFVYDMLVGDWPTLDQYLWRYRIGIKVIDNVQ